MTPTPQMKQAYYIFKLYLPSLQFIALLIALALTAACSPLSPSTDRNMTPKGKEIGILQATDLSNARVNEIVQQDFLANSLQEIGTTDTIKLTEKDLEQKTHSSILLNAPELSAKAIDEAFQNKEKLGEFPLVTILLPVGKQDDLYRDSQIRINLLSLVRDPDQAKVKGLFGRLQALMKEKNLGASAYLLFADKDHDLIDSSSPLKVRVSLALNEMAILELKRTEDSNASALESTFRDAKQMVIVLE